MQHLTDLKSEMPTKTAELLGELRDQNQCPVAITGESSLVNTPQNTKKHHCGK